MATLRELIAALEELQAQVEGDVEVRIAEQPNYPFEYAISQVRLVNPKEDEDYAFTKEFYDNPETSEEDKVKAHEELERIEALPTILYICEGSQLCYASKNLWDEDNAIRL